MVSARNHQGTVPWLLSPIENLWRRAVFGADANRLGPVGLRNAWPQPAGGGAPLVLLNQRVNVIGPAQDPAR